MRFVLDHDVPASCRRVLTKARHQAWTVGEAGRAEAADDDQSVYAGGKRAVLITLDSEFTSRRRRNAIGQHIRLDCPEPDAADLLARYLDAILGVLSTGKDVTIIVRPGDMHVSFAWS